MLSPHLDDAVLALGGTVARLARAGHAVEVCTAFTAGPPPHTLPRRQRAFADYAARIAEDDEALALLGAIPRRLGLTERVWREPRPRTLAAAFRTPAVTAGFDRLPALLDAVGEILARPGVTLYAPLGVGHHVDHLEVALAVLTAATARDALGRVGFYEDFYALGEGFRRRHPVTRRRRHPAREAPGWAAPVAGLAFALAPAVPRGPGLEHYLPGVGGWAWRCEPQPVDGVEEVKLAAIGAYRSQVARLGGGRRVAALTRRGHATRGGELVWRAGPR